MLDVLTNANFEPVFEPVQSISLVSVEWNENYSNDE